MRKRQRKRLSLLLLPGMALAILLGMLVATSAQHSRGAPPGIPYAWGGNQSGELGDGTTTDSSVAVQVAHLSNAVAVSAGLAHSLALDATGQVWAWGYNLHAQLGDGSTTDRDTPVSVAGLPLQIVAIAAGHLHSLALDANGQVWAWGENGSGQLGPVPHTSINLPVLVAGLPSGIVAIAGGNHHSLALDGNGQVWAWGSNAEGQLGDGTFTDHDLPMKIVGQENIFRAIAAGDVHSLALDADGQVWAWGRDSEGELGDGTTNDSPIPVQAVFPPGVRIVAISAGYYHSLALDATGQVWAWGSNLHGELGDGTTTGRLTPVPVVGLPSPIVAISGGSQYSLALDANGYVWAWGWNMSGKLGDGTTTDRSTPVPVFASGGGLLSGVTAIAAGGGHSLAIAGAVPPTSTPTPCVPISETGLCQTPTPTPTPCPPDSDCPTPTPSPTPCVPIPGTRLCQTPTPTPTPCPPTVLAVLCATPTPSPTPCVPTPSTALCPTPTPSPTPCPPTASTALCATPTPSPTPSPTPCVPTPSTALCPTPTPSATPCTIPGTNMPCMPPRYSPFFGGTPPPPH